MTTTVRLDVAETGSDAERVDQLTRALRDELRQLDVDDVRAGNGSPAPDGARGVDAATVGTLAVALFGSGGLTAVVAAVRDFVDRGASSSRSVRLELDGDVLELTGASSSEQQQMVEAFLGRHGGSGTTWAADGAR